MATRTGSDPTEGPEPGLHPAEELAALRATITFLEDPGPLDSATALEPLPEFVRRMKRLHPDGIGHKQPDAFCEDD